MAHIVSPRKSNQRGEGSDRERGTTVAGNASCNQLERVGVLGDLEKMIKIQQVAVLLTPDGHPNKSALLTNLAFTLSHRFERTGTLSDIDEAIKNQQQAVLLIPDGHPGKSGGLGNLATFFNHRFQRTGMLSDIDKSIKIQQQAVSLTPNDHVDKPGWVSNLGNAFESRFELTGRPNDIEEAIKHQQQAILLVSDDHPHKLACLANLGNSLARRFEHTGKLSDIDEAIKSQQQVVLLTPSGHPNRSKALGNLAGSFNIRFRRTEMLSDVDAAIKNLQEAILLTPDDHPHKPAWLNNLGISFASRFERTGMPNDINEAIKYHRQAISLVPDGHPNKLIWLCNLGTALKCRFQCTGMLSDIDEAIKHQQQAFSLAPDDHRQKPALLNNLSVSLAQRFERTGMLSDIDEAIKNLRRAIALTPDDRPDKLLQVISLAISFESRFVHTKSPRDLDESISHFRMAATSNICPSLIRSRASREWARLEAKRDPPSSLVAYRRAIDLLPQVAWIGDPIDTRHSQLNELEDTPREAAAFALNTGDPNLALEWLEQGRSVVWNQLLNLRTPVHDLRQAHPDICAEFTQVSHELRSATIRGHSTKPTDEVKALLQEETQHHHRLAEKWDSLTEKIRSLPEFQDFLVPKKVSVLKKAAKSGPVIVINIHPRRCDALVLEHGRDDVLHIPLDKIRYEDVENMRKSLGVYLANPHRTQRWTERAGAPVPMSISRMAGILEKTYSGIVFPILQRLGLTTGRPEPRDLPHIWWCPTGPLTFLPLHAACRKSAEGIEGTFDYVISSYTPTVNALLEARAVTRQPFKQLIGIALTDTPGQSLLPGAKKEMARIDKLFSDETRWRFKILQNEEATGEQVLTHMANSSWIHLACHAIQDKKAPTRSGFCLHDQRLAITDIIAKPFASADLAFLSACQTATGDEKASDEAVHITGAMLGAGYRSVIGTMWAIPDEAAPIIAEKVYKNLLSGGEPNSERAARALHEAVQELRKLSPDSFNSWVPFVHYGV